MIEGAVLKLSVSRKDGAVLMVYEQDVVVQESFAIKGDLKVTSSAGETALTVNEEGLRLCDADSTSTLKPQVTMADSSSQAEDLTISIKTETCEQDSQADIPMPASEAGDKEPGIDAGVQSGSSAQLRTTETQTADLATEQSKTKESEPIAETSEKSSADRKAMEEDSTTSEDSEEKSDEPKEANDESSTKDEDCNKAEDSNDCNKAEDSNDCNKAEDSNDCNKGEDSNDCNKGEDSNDCNKGEDSNDCNKAEDSNEEEDAEMAEETDKGEVNSEEDIDKDEDKKDEENDKDEGENNDEDTETDNRKPESSGDSETEGNDKNLKEEPMETSEKVDAEPENKRKKTKDNSSLVTVSTQTEIDDQPILKDLLARLGELKAQQADSGLGEPSTSGGFVGKRLRKRLYQRPLSSTEGSDDDNDGLHYEDDRNSDDYVATPSFEKVTTQWNKDLHSVIASLTQDDSGRHKQPKTNNAKNHVTTPAKPSKRKRGRPKKIPQELKPMIEDDDDISLKSSPDKDTPKKVWECPGCGEIFHKRAFLTKHKQECTLAHMGTPSSHEKTGVYQCPVCDKTYTKMSHMRRHQKSHTDVREHVCQYCSKAFFRKEHRDKHELTHQSLKCQYCDEVVTGKSNLLRHEKSHFPHDPTPKKPAKKTTPCRYCGKLFGGRAQCEQHEITHTNEKPFKCSYCDLSFSKRGNTLKHERRIHLHLKPYLCQYCGKAFAQKPDCKKHEMRHLGEKRVKCNYCDKMFLENHHRIVHERTHTGERPYKCVICNHAFAQSYDCKKHMRIHLKDKGGPKQGATGTAEAGPLLEESKAVEYLQLQVRQAKAAVMESESIQQQMQVAQQQQRQMEEQQQHQQQQQQQAPQHPPSQPPVLEHPPQMYPIYDYQAIPNPDYMMQVAASGSLHQMVPQAPPPSAVFAPHHDLHPSGAPPYMQNSFDIRKMQEIMGSQNNGDNSAAKLMP